MRIALYILIAVIMFVAAFIEGIHEPTVGQLENMKWQLVFYKAIVGIYALAIAFGNE